MDSREAQCACGFDMADDVVDENDLFGGEPQPFHCGMENERVRLGGAWLACRSGADPMTFGVAGTAMWGLVEVYGDLFQDLAALQNNELLPWGWYGLAKDERGMAETALIDRLAGLSSRADAAAMDELREVLAGDPRLRAPDDMPASIMETEGAAALGKSLAP